jgi:hypothetical protein
VSRGGRYGLLVFGRIVSPPEYGFFNPGPYAPDYVSDAYREADPPQCAQGAIHGEGKWRETSRPQSGHLMRGIPTIGQRAGSRTRHEGTRRGQRNPNINRNRLAGAQAAVRGSVRRGSAESVSRLSVKLLRAPGRFASHAAVELAHAPGRIGHMVLVPCNPDNTRDDNNGDCRGNLDENHTSKIRGRSEARSAGPATDAQGPA